ncbi:MAG TPA: type III pantothenate kinase [Rectinemataceae bacterium]|nr:type III pantothenate kinase [Rectinemataceae bacterium]
MLLVFDIGNTDIVGGIHERGRIQATFRLRSIAKKTEDEYAATISSLLGERGIDVTAIERVVISSVVPALTATIVAFARSLCGREPLLIGPDSYDKLPLDLPSPREIGTDLVANALAAFRKTEGPAIIADFGTALTFTAVRGDGKVLGVAIAPGLGTAIDSLTRNTAQLPSVELVAPPTVLGTDTVMSIRAGVVHGYAGLVSHLVARMKSEMGGKAKVFATGGLCEIIAPLVDCFDSVERNLTLDGLAFAADYL